MKFKLTKKIISMLCLCLLLVTCCGSAAAAEAIDLERTTSVQIQYQVGQERAADVGFPNLSGGPGISKPALYLNWRLCRLCGIIG